VIDFNDNKLDDYHSCNSYVMLWDFCSIFSVVVFDTKLCLYQYWKLFSSNKLPW